MENKEYKIKNVEFFDRKHRRAALRNVMNAAVDEVLTLRTGDVRRRQKYRR